MRHLSPAVRRASPSWFRLTAILALLASTLTADDWPQWLGPKRDGVWREADIVTTLPVTGPKVLWRVPVNPGYVGPAVVGDKLFMVDRLAGKMPERVKGQRSLPVIPGEERVVCLDARTGKAVWEYRYDAAYRIGYPNGPRATPVVAGNRVYTLGAMGALLCLDANNGQMIWSRNFPQDFNLSEPPTWGWAAHPLLDGSRLICLVGGTNSAVVAFHKDDGREVWRALTAVEIGYAPPMIYNMGGQRQLVVWHPEAVSSLVPETGRVLWSHRYPVQGKVQRPEVTIATPRADGDKLFLTSYYHGSLMLQVTNDPPGATVFWDRHSSSKSKMNDGLHTVMSTPVVEAGLIFGICGMGELRCLDARTGDRLWETYAVNGGQEGLFANAFLVRQAERSWIWNDQGELILAKLTAPGYEEIGRVKLLATSEHSRGREVLWCHPAFANRCAYMHNGKELICVDLGVKG